jgi:fructokinase
MKNYKIGIDLGGTKTEAILLNPDNRDIFRQRISTPKEHGYDAILGSTHELILNVANRIPHQINYSIGIGIPGSINTDTDLVQNANTTCLIGRPLQKDIENLIGRTITVENDANCFALAESRSGAGRTYPLVFGIIMGTGCGGGICMNGTIHKGPNRIAGEWGHFSVDPGGAECYCGNRGCVETKISGSGVEAAFFRTFDKHVTMQDITMGYRAGDPQCTETFLHFLDDFGRCLGGLISVLDPDVVVLGGGLSNIDELYTMGVERVRKYTFHQQIKTPVLRNMLGDSAGVYGAAWIGCE